MLLRDGDLSTPAYAPLASVRIRASLRIILLWNLASARLGRMVLLMRKLAINARLIGAVARAQSEHIALLW